MKIIKIGRADLEGILILIKIIKYNFLKYF